MTTARTMFAGLAALTAAFSLSACGQQVGSATDQSGAVVEGARNTVGGYAINEITSPHQPNTVIISTDFYKGGGVATVSTIDAEAGQAQLLRQYTIGDTTHTEFTPAADRNTVCTLIDGYESGDLTCTRVTRTPSTRAPGA